MGRGWAAFLDGFGSEGLRSDLGALSALLLCVEKRSTEEIRKVAIEEGMQTLREDGLEKVKMGVTSLEEIMRVVV